MQAGKMLATSPSLGCISQGLFHITVVAFCHLAVTLKLPEGQNKGEKRPGLVRSGSANILTSLGGQAGAAQGCWLHRGSWVLVCARKWALCSG